MKFKGIITQAVNNFKKGLRKRHKASASSQLKRLKKSAVKLQELTEKIQLFDEDFTAETHIDNWNCIKEARETLVDFEKEFHEFNAYNNTYKTVCEYLREE